MLRGFGRLSSWFSRRFPYFSTVFGSQLLYGLLIAGLATLIAVGEVLFSALSRPWLRHVAGAGGLPPIR